MKLKIIEELKKAKPKKRAKILLAMHVKNVAYFKNRNPDLGNFLETQGTGGFEIRVNEVFLDVIENKTGEYCHTPGRLLDYIETVASWHHSGWIDKMELVHRHLRGHEHGRLIHAMLEGIYANLPQISARMRSGKTRLPKTKNGRRFSGSTVFLGALTGLHIVQYLNTTEVRDVVIIEPDAMKFALSCCFVDYEAIERRFGRLVLHVGEEMPENPLNYLLGSSPVTASTWMRMLPIYPSAMFDEIINRINLRWRIQHEILVPFDRELRNLTYGATNLRDGRPILCRQPDLSKESRIAAIGSGPSLDRDLEWLKANRSGLIVFAVHSAVRALKKHGIKPDFQCTLDTELDEEILARLDLDPAIPLIAYYKMDSATLKKFKTILLVQENGKANAVYFHHPFGYTHPTSGNTTVAAAIHMRPAELFLLGLDFGYRDAKQSHVSGSLHYDPGADSQHDAESRDNIQTQPNFAESEGTVFTHAYYDVARKSVEMAVASAVPDVKVYNLSDGARIAGAEPRHSQDVVVDSYPGRDGDLKSIQAAFVGGAEGVWSPYANPGEKMLQILKEALLDALRIKDPGWIELATALDTAWSKAVAAWGKADPDDTRYEAYSKLIQDLLTDWYRVIIFTHSPEEFAIAYTAGLRQLEFVLDKLHFPPEVEFEAVPTTAAETV